MRPESVLISSLILTCAAFAWLQAAPVLHPASAQQAAGEDDCLEQEDANAQAAAQAPAAGPRPAVRSAGGRTPLPPEMIEQVLLVADDVDPALANNLRRQRQRDPEGFARAMRTTGRRLLGMAELRSRDPQLYGFKLQELRIDKQVLNAAERLRESMRGGSGDVEQRTEDLRTYVRIKVALSIKARVEYLARLRDHMIALEGAINRDALNFEKTVDERVRQLLASPSGSDRARLDETIPDE
jgi:hypothetical protein